MNEHKQDLMKRISRSLTRIFTSCAVFFVLGYLPVVLLKDFRFSMIAAAAAIIPLGSTAKSPWRGLARGVGLGVVAGYAMASAMVNIQAKAAQPQSQPFYVLTSRGLTFYISATAFICGVVGLLFAIMAQRRRRLIEQQWQDGQV
jgi:hypothetical protein